MSIPYFRCPRCDTDSMVVLRTDGIFDQDYDMEDEDDDDNSFCTADFDIDPDYKLFKSQHRTWRCKSCGALLVNGSGEANIIHYINEHPIPKKTDPQLQVADTATLQAVAILVGLPAGANWYQIHDEIEKTKLGSVPATTSSDPHCDTCAFRDVCEVEIEDEEGIDSCHRWRAK